MTSTKGIIIGGVKKIKEITSSEAILELENTPLKIKGNNLALVKTNNDINTIELEGEIYGLEFKAEKKKEKEEIKNLQKS